MAIMREISFNNQGNQTYMVMELDPADQIDSLSMGMITNNEIPGLLPVSIRRRNNVQYLYYNISSLTPLSAGYRSLSSDKRLLTFLRSLCRLAEECAEYLITPDMLFLDEEHIYIKITTGELFAAYLPFNSEVPNYSPYSFVKDVIGKVGTQLPNDSRILPALLRLSFLPEDQFSLEMLDEQLAKLQIDGAVQAEPPAHVRQPESSRPTHATTPPEWGRAPADVSEPAVTPGPVSPRTPQIESKPLPSQYDAKAEPKRKSLFGGGQQKNRGSSNPSQSGGFSFAVPGADIQPSADEVSPAQPAETKKEKKERKGGLSSLFKSKPKEQPATAVKPVSEQQPVSVQQPSAQHLPAEQSVSAHYAAVSSSGAGGYTVNLSGMDSGASLATSPMMPGMGIGGGVTQLWLVCRSNGQRMQITHNNFHIGRGKDLVDFVVATSTAFMGMDHAYILLQQGKYYIVDNNSMNHTWLNGQLLESSRPYPLNSGDVVRMADEIFDLVEQ